MKTTKIMALSALVLLCSYTSQAQEEIQTIFKKGFRPTGYGALTTKFTSIGSNAAIMEEIYGGIFINKKFFIGLSGSATTNYIEVPAEFSVSPNDRMSYLYGQVGVMNEYVIKSNKAVHATFTLFNGAGYTLQYDRPRYYEDNYPSKNLPTDLNWFFVTEPGVQVEFNLLKWLRVSPGVSYRFAQGSGGKGLSDSKLSAASANLTLKIGKF